MVSLKSPCKTRLSIETIALNCLIFEKIVFFFRHLGDRQTDEHTDRQNEFVESVNALSLSRVANLLCAQANSASYPQRRLNNIWLDAALTAGSKARYMYRIRIAISAYPTCICSDGSRRNFAMPFGAGGLAPKCLPGPHIFISLQRYQTMYLFLVHYICCIITIVVTVTL